MEDTLITIGLLSIISFLGVTRLTLVNYRLEMQIGALKHEISKLSHIKKDPPAITVTDLVSIRKIVQEAKEKRINGGVEIYNGVDQELPSWTREGYVYKGQYLTHKMAEEVLYNKFKETNIPVHVSQL